MDSREKIHQIEKDIRNATEQIFTFKKVLEKQHKRVKRLSFSNRWACFWGIWYSFKD